MRVRTAILTAVLGLGLASVTAFSKPLTATEDTQCLTIGVLAQQLAELRDQGITRVQMIQVANANSSPLTKESNEAIVAVHLWLVPPFPRPGAVCHVQSLQDRGAEGKKSLRHGGAYAPSKGAQRLCAQP